MSDGLLLPCTDFFRAAQTEGGVVSADQLATPTSTDATPTGVVGSNQEYAALSFPNGGAANALRLQRLPPDIHLAAGIGLRLFWSISVTSGSVRWTAETAFADDDDDLDPAFNAADAVITPAAASADVRITSEIAALDLTGAVAGAMLFLRIGRDPAHGSDTAAGDAMLLGAELVYQRRVVLP